MSKKWYWNLLDWSITKTNHDFYPSLFFHLLEKAYSPENKKNKCPLKIPLVGSDVYIYIFPSEVVPLKRGHSFVSGWCSLATNPPIRSISLPGGAKRTTWVPQTLVFAFWAAEKMGREISWWLYYTQVLNGWNIIPGRVPGMVGVMDFSLNHPD